MQQHGRGSPPAASNNIDARSVVGAHPATAGTGDNAYANMTSQQQPQQQQQLPASLAPAHQLMTTTMANPAAFQDFRTQMTAGQIMPQQQQQQQQQLHGQHGNTVPTINNTISTASSISPQMTTNAAEQIGLPMLPGPPQQPQQQQLQQQQAPVPLLQMHQQQQQQASAVSAAAPMAVLSSSSPFTSLQYANPPNEDPSPVEAEQLLAGAMYGLSTEERDQALADVHGVAAAGQLDNEFIATRLAQLDQAIHDLRTNKSAYLRAKIQNPEYVSDRKFRLQFLLADSFQPVAAAERLVSFFESKLVLFGPDKLTKDLTLQDLDEQDTACLENGLVQRLVGRDHAGRVVVSCWPSVSTNGTSMAGPMGAGDGTGGSMLQTTAPTATGAAGPPLHTVVPNQQQQQQQQFQGYASNTTGPIGGAPLPYPTATLTAAAAAPTPTMNTTTPTPAPIPDDPTTGFAVDPSRPQLQPAAPPTSSVGADSSVSASPEAAAAAEETRDYHDHYVRYECDQIIDLDTWKHQLKAYWYMVNSISEEEKEMAHRNGFVSVVFGMGPSRNADRMALWKIMYLFRSLPVRVSSIHYCYDDPQSRPLADMSIIALDPKSRARFRTHFGPQGQIVSELSSFGIGSNLLTVDPRSEEAAMVIREWFAARRLKESSHAALKTAPAATSVGDVGRYDVLFGRGKGIQAHPGNKRLRELVEANLERYERASRLEKTLMAETIVRNIKDTSGRFLKLESASRGSGWTEVNDEIARDKIAHAFRTQRKSLLQKEKDAKLELAKKASQAQVPSPIPYVPQSGPVPALQPLTGPAGDGGGKPPAVQQPGSGTGAMGQYPYVNPHDPSQQYGGGGGGPNMY